MPREVVIQGRASILLGLALTLCFPSGARADGEDAGYPGAFLRYGASVRSLGMGRAAVALGGCPGLFLDNPAALMRVGSRRDLYLMHRRPPDAFTAGANGLSQAFLAWSVDPATTLGTYFVQSDAGKFEQRSENDEVLASTLGFREAAFGLAAAREIVRPGFVLDAGLGLRYVRQEFSGHLTGQADDGAFAVDVGAQIQLVSPFGSREQPSLRNLLPLRIGVALQNVNGPTLGINGYEEEVPAVLRVGCAYEVPVNSYPVLLAFDVEDWLSARRGLRGHGGVELPLPFSDSTWSAVRVRAGARNINGSATFVAGLGVDPRGTASDGIPRLDAAVDFTDGVRFNVGVAFGLGGSANRKDAAFFRSAGARPVTQELRVLAHFHSSSDAVQAAQALMSHDPSRRLRYAAYVGGAALGRALHDEMLRALWKDDVRGAVRLAENATAVFDSLRRSGEFAFTDVEDYIAYAEARLVRDSEGHAAMCQADSALTTAALPEHALSAKALYVRGVAAFQCHKFEVAAGYFEQAAGKSSASDTLQALCRYGRAQALIHSDRHDEAATVLNELQDAEPLTRRYPRYHPPDSWGDSLRTCDGPRPAECLRPFPDLNLRDNVLFALAECATKLRPEDAPHYLADIWRFYPDSELWCAAASRLGTLLGGAQ